MNDQELILKIRKNEEPGCSRAITSIEERNRPKTDAYFYKYFSQHLSYLKEDVYQDTRIGFCTSIRKLKRQIRSLNAYWIGLFRYKTLDLFGKKLKSKEISFSHEDPEGMLLEGLKDTSLLMDEIMEMKAFITSFAKSLNKNERACFLLRLREDMDYREIAEQLSLSVNTVNQYCSNVKRKLKEAVKSYGA
jgi:RNA polymerase sigma factor (sigma-70 family)